MPPTRYSAATVESQVGDPYVSSVRAAGPQLDPSSELDAFFGALPATTREIALWALTHPVRVQEARSALGRLPQLEASPTGSPDGRALAAGLRRRSAAARLLTRGATPVIEIPACAEGYTNGGRRRTLRKKRNEALRRGVTWRSIDDPGERDRLRVLANQVERTHPDARYRSMDPDNEDLLDLSRWWLAEDAAGIGLLLAVVAVDGDWALLRYFVTLQRHNTAALAARFLMMQVIVEQLVRDGVRHLVTNMSPIRLTPGLRQFQRHVGFELRRVRTGRQGAEQHRSAPLVRRA